MISYGTKVSSPVALLTVIGLIVVAIVLMLAPVGRVSGQTTISVTPDTFGDYFDDDPSDDADPTNPTYGKPLSGMISNGDTVEFAVGTYTTPIHIVGYEDLTLQGTEDTEGNRAKFAVGEDRVLSRTLDPDVTGGSREYVVAGILVDGSTNILVNNLSFDLSQVPIDNSKRPVGVFYIDSSGTVSANQLFDIGNPESNSIRDYSIYVLTDSSYSHDNRVPVTISENTIKDGGRVAILASRWVNATISDNVIRETSGDFGYGAEFAAGAHGSITGNTISGYGAKADAGVSGSGGIVYVSNWFTPSNLGRVVTNATISGNILQNNYTSIYIGSGWCGTADGTELDMVATIADNQIQETYRGIFVASCLAPAEEDGEDIELTITGNNFLDAAGDRVGDYGIYIANGGVTGPGNGSVALTASDNTFIGLTRAMWVDLTDAAWQPGVFGTLELTRLDVRYNYWGTGINDPLGTQLLIHEGVSLPNGFTYDPWYADTVVEGISIPVPDEPTTVRTPDEDVIVEIPAEAVDSTYRYEVEVGADLYEDQAPPGTVHQGVTVELTEIKTKNPITKLEEGASATLTIEISAVDWRGVGGAKLKAANNQDRLFVYKRSGPGAKWNLLPGCSDSTTRECYEVTESADGSAAAIEIRNISSFGQFALVVVAAEPNVAPFAVGRIPDQVIVMDGSSHTLDVSGYFRDLDNDFLRYAPQSVDPMVLTATVMGNTVVFNPGGLGTTSMVVIAFDKADATAYQTFMITVVEPEVPNVAPEAVGAIEDQTVQVGDEPLELDVADYFTDADGDELTYMAASSDEAIATVTAMGSTISLTGVAAGEATITVTATDPSGESAMQMFMVTVSLPNTAPEAVGFIEDQVMLENGVPMEIDVAEYFTDADGDELEYTAESANAEVVTSVLTDGETVMVLSPFAPGEGVEVTVTATDPAGESATQSFMVTVLEAMMPVEPTATPEPTPEPTMAPTPEPTVAPTVVPTVAPTVAPEVDDGGGFPAWAIVLILLIVVGVGAGVFVMRRNRS